MACDILLTTTCSKLSTDMMQVDCQNLLSTGLLQIALTSCNKSDFNRLCDFSIYGGGGGAWGEAYIQTRNFGNRIYATPYMNRREEFVNFKTNLLLLHFILPQQVKTRDPWLQATGAQRNLLHT